MKLAIRRFGMVAIVGALALFSAGCGSQGVSEPASPGEGGQQVARQQEEVVYHIGDTVATDIAELTLDDSQLAIALTASMPIGAHAPAPLDTDYGLPKEYDLEEDADSPYVASKGHTLVFFSWTVKNLDRGSISFESGALQGGQTVITNAGDRLGAVEYDGGTYDVNIDNRKFTLVVDDEGGWKIGSENAGTITLDAGQSKVCRGYIDAPVEASSLDDPYKLIVDLPNSDGNKVSFVYEIG